MYNSSNNNSNNNNNNSNDNNDLINHKVVVINKNPNAITISSFLLDVLVFAQITGPTIWSLVGTAKHQTRWVVGRIKLENNFNYFTVKNFFAPTVSNLSTILLRSLKIAVKNILSCREHPFFFVENIFKILVITESCLLNFADRKE